MTILFSFLASVLLALLAGTLFFAKSIYRSANRLLAILFILFSSNMLLTALRFHLDRADAYLLNVVIGLSIGPLIFLYCQSILKQQNFTHKKQLFHFIPISLLLIAEWLDAPIGATKDILISTSMLTYAIVSSRSLFLKRAVWNQTQSHNRYLYYFMWLLVCLLGFLITIDLLIFFQGQYFRLKSPSSVLSIGVTLFALMALFFTFSSLTRLKYTDWMFAAKYTTAKESHGYDAEQKHSSMELIKKLMTEQKVYLNDSLTLADISQQTGLPSRLVSQAINQSTGKTFRRYINDLRIEEAKRLLVETDAPILNIMFDVGFKTKSNFNKEFSQTTGMSPKDYRDRK